MDGPRVMSPLAPERYVTANWQLGVYALFYVFTVAVIGLTSYAPGQSQLLRKMTIENSFYELSSLAVLVILNIYCLRQFVRFRELETVPVFMKLSWLIIGILAFLVAGEEISWGQHIFGFSSGDYFLEHNRQQETNLHNFIPGRYLTGFINTSVFTFFIFVPAVLWLFPGFIQYLGLFAHLVPSFMPSFHISLMMCFSSTLLPYFLPTSVSSTVGLFSALICTAVLIWRIEVFRSAYYLVHWLAVVLAMIFFMINTHVFSFYNMQAEVREFFVMLIGSFWVIEWSDRVTKQALD